MKKLVVMLFGIFLVISLVGCGGGSKKKDKDQIGVTMDQASITKHYEEVLDAYDGLEIAGTVLQVAMDGYMTEKSKYKIASDGSLEEDGEDDKALVWSTTPDSKGWYTAVDSWSSPDGSFSYTYTFKLRLLKTGVIEYSETYESKKNGVVEEEETYTEFMSISKGNDGLWNGYKTEKESGYSQEITFKNLNSTYGSGTFTLSIQATEGTVSGEFTISWDGAKFNIKGTLKINNKTLTINKSLTPEEIDQYEGGDEGESGEG